MKKAVLLFLLVFFSLPQSPAQELELAERHDEVLKNILRMNILVTVTRPEEEPWKTSISKLTIPGRVVSVKLEGQEIKIQGSFTPYHFSKTLMLLAQAQVTFLPTEDSRLRYFTSMKTLAITLGEKIHFFPLGQQKEIELSSGTCDIEIELQIVAFKPTEEEKAIMDDLLEGAKPGETTVPEEGEGD